GDLHEPKPAHSVRQRRRLSAASRFDTEGGGGDRDVDRCPPGSCDPRTRGRGHRVRPWRVAGDDAKHDGRVSNRAEGSVMALEHPSRGGYDHRRRTGTCDSASYSCSRSSRSATHPDLRLVGVTREPPSGTTTVTW